MSLSSPSPRLGLGGVLTLPATASLDRKPGRTRNDGATTVFDVRDVGRPRTDPLDPSIPHRDGLAAYPGGSVRPRPVALVVDDELVVGSIICKLLVRHGWQTVAVADAENALSHHAAGEIDLLVTDFELPGITGLTLVQLLRERDPGLPIIVVSGWPDAAGLVESSCVGFVSKPIDFDEFMHQVRTLAS